MLMDGSFGTTCEECGPISEGDATEPSEAHATVTFTTHSLRDIVVIDHATITACSPPEGCLEGDR